MSLPSFPKKKSLCQRVEGNAGAQVHRQAFLWLSGRSGLSRLLGARGNLERRLILQRLRCWCLSRQGQGWIYGWNSRVCQRALVLNLGTALDRVKDWKPSKLAQRGGWPVRYHLSGSIKTKGFRRRYGWFLINCFWRLCPQVRLRSLQDCSWSWRGWRKIIHNLGQDASSFELGNLGFASSATYCLRKDRKMWNVRTRTDCFT